MALKSQRDLRTRDKEVERRSLLDGRKKDDMLAVLIRNQRAFETVHEVITPEHLRKISDGYAVMWRTVKEFYDKYSEMPSRAQIIAEMESENDAANGELLNDDDLKDIKDFLKGAFDDVAHGRDISRSSVHRKVAVETAQLFLQECVTSDLQDTLIKNGKIPVNLPEALQVAVDRVGAALFSGDAMFRPVIEEGWDTEQRMTMIPTGFATWDTFLGGGYVGGEVYVFMGPFGSCKTLLTVKLVCEMAKRYQTKFRDGETDGKRPVVFLVSTEMDKAEFRLRALSYLAKIPAKRLRMMKSKDELCKKNKKAATPETAYENQLFADLIGDQARAFVNEYTRLEAAIVLINAHVFFVEMTDANPDYPDLGADGMKDAARYIAAVLRGDKTLVPCGLFVDHAMMMMQRMVNKGTRRADEERQILAGIPALGVDLAKKYNIPCVIMHQLSGEANGRRSASVMGYSDAAGCKSFVQAAAFSIVATKPTEDHRQLSVFRCDKHRREPPSGHAIVHVDGAFGNLEDRSDQYVIYGGKILHVDDIDTRTANENMTRKRMEDETKAGLDN
jgi:hypothetical protein